MLNTNQERAALTLFARSGITQDYKRMLCFAVWHLLQKNTQERAVPLDNFINTTADKLMVERQDVRAAVAALKTPSFKAAAVWNRRGTGLPLVQAKDSEPFSKWLEAVNSEYPYFAVMVAA